MLNGPCWASTITRLWKQPTIQHAEPNSRNTAAYMAICKGSNSMVVLLATLSVSKKYPLMSITLMCDIYRK